MQGVLDSGLLQSLPAVRPGASSRSATPRPPPTARRRRRSTRSTSGWLRCSRGEFSMPAKTRQERRRCASGSRPHGRRRRRPGPLDPHPGTGGPAHRHAQPGAAPADPGRAPRRASRATSRRSTCRLSSRRAPELRLPEPDSDMLRWPRPMPVSRELRRSRLRPGRRQDGRRCRRRAGGSPRTGGRGRAGTARARHRPTRWVRHPPTGTTGTCSPANSTPPSRRSHTVLEHCHPARAAGRSSMAVPSGSRRRRDM